MSVIVLVGLYISGRMYFNTRRIFKENWGIELPKGMKEVFQAKTDMGFHGDVTRYTVFSVEETNTFFDEFNNTKNLNIEESFCKYLNGEGILYSSDILEIPSQQLPNWEHSYTWKYIEKDNDCMYMIFDKETKQLFILEVIM